MTSRVLLYLPPKKIAQIVRSMAKKLYALEVAGHKSRFQGI